MRVRDWLQPLLRDWGGQRRRVLSGRRVFGDGYVHEDGWPKSSATDLARSGGLTGGSGSATQHFAEVYSEHVMPVWRAWQLSPIQIREPLHMHYVVNVPLRERYAIIGINATTYFGRLRVAEHFIGGVVLGLDGTQPPDGVFVTQERIGDLLGTAQQVVARWHNGIDVATAYLEGWRMGLESQKPRDGGVIAQAIEPKSVA